MLGLAGGVPLLAAGRALASSGPRERNATLNQPATEPTSRMPVLFVGHGSPMNAIEDNPWSRGFRKLPELLPRPRAILSVSAHWYADGIFTTGNARPETIHDFGGFPRELFEMQYPAPGEPVVANRAVTLLASAGAEVRTDWGLDHGTWTVLHHMYPRADIPVVQLSIDERLAPAGHLALGQALAPLRGEGILILASGTLTHNLRYEMTQGAGARTPPPWAARFDADAARAAQQHDADFLARAVEAPDGRMSHPTLDHYLPLLYAVGAADKADPVQFPLVGFDGSLSMRAVLFG